MSDQTTDQQGFMLTTDNDELLISDSGGGGQNLGLIVDRNEAQRAVASYITENANWIAIELVNQLDFEGGDNAT